MILKLSESAIVVPESAAGTVMCTISVPEILVSGSRTRLSFSYAARTTYFPFFHQEHLYVNLLKK